MQTILILGIGRSTYYLLQYLNEYIASDDIAVTALDAQQALVEKRSREFSKIRFIRSEINEASLLPVISNSTIVVSMLPPAFHTMVAKLCLDENKHLFTASYVSAEVKAMSEQAKSQGLLFMMECGLDPGIDHMSAITLIHTLKEQGAQITSFKSYTGGLVHPSNTNPPWNYKVSWNPRNVVLAGQGAAAHYLEDGIVKIVPYHRLFTNPSIWKLSDTNVYEGYPNRDSLSYQKLYALESAETFVRGTLRYPGFCEGWNYLVQLGLTDDSIILKEDPSRTGRSFLQHFLLEGTETIQDKLKELFQENASEATIFLESLGLLSDTEIATQAATAATILQSVIEKKWKLEAEDCDRIVMIHRISYVLKGEKQTIQSSMIVDGEDSERTAMAKTVGLPLAISIDLFLNGNISERGVVIPVDPLLAKTILSKLESLGVCFKEMKL
ncbi:saccharopine dehydrogenase family protein [Cytophaga aurantiaca]|uniref:saccharopine dehydrogenase family protein n=1 Tax=Cytophaga aurantiaca TaxID=29530 RepID=UPI00037FC7A2|nr:saccharopine dehydrogenase C-terminal domain-containing protein [Cytophaga aurantiaca]